MDPTSDQINVILNAIQTGGLVSALTLGILAFARGWVYTAKIVDDLKQQVKDLTQALHAANQGMEKMADAWEARNQIERERALEQAQWDRRKRNEGR